MVEEKNLSWGKVVEKGSLNQINLPEEMINSFINKTETENLLVVFTPRQNILKIDVFPVENKEIIKVQLHLTQFSGMTVKQIGKIIREMNIPKNLFTSGVCLQSNLCIYEAYIEQNKLEVSIDVLKEKFRQVDNVIDVNIFTLDQEK